MTAIDTGRGRRCQAGRASAVVAAAVPSWAVAVVGGVVAVDQATKAAAGALAAGSTHGAVVPVTNPELSLGVAGGPPLVLALAAMVGIVAFGALTVRLAARGRLPWVVPALLMGGAVSNLVDRVALGAVRDFLATPWVIVNVADVAVLAGLVVYAVALLRPGRREEVTP